MRRILRWGTRLLFLTIIVGAVALVWRWDDLIRLYRVNTLFDEAKIVQNFSHMDSSFLTRPIPQNGPVFPLRARPIPLPESFQFRDQTVQMADFLADRATTSLLVLRDDEVTFEEYYLDTGPEDLRISWSVAKSFISALVGIALSEGAIASLDDPVEKYAPTLAGSAYEGVSIRNVLNMASGVEFDEDYLDYDSDINKMGRALAFGRSMDKFAASQDRKAGPPGEAFRYVSIDTHVIAMVLLGATGASLPDYLEQKIWSRIGPEAGANFVTDGLGVAFALGGLNMRTRDYARFGRLILNRGNWEGEQIVPADWIAQSTRPSAPPPAPGARADWSYGYHWWIPPGAEDEFLARGIYGQYIYIDPDKRMVIVKTSADRRFRKNDEAAALQTVAAFRAIAATLAPAESPASEESVEPSE
jgi:CubicO group peptidase (beta-lactamase class C family)